MVEGVDKKLVDYIEIIYFHYMRKMSLDMVFVI